MPNRTMQDSIEIRIMIQDAVEREGLCTVSGIMKYVADRGQVVTQMTVNKILKSMGYAPRFLDGQWTWEKKEAV